MRGHRHFGGLVQLGVEPLVHLGHEIGGFMRTFTQQSDDLVFALAAMPDHAAHQLARFFDRFAMRGIEDPVLARVELLEAFHIVAHVTIGRDHDAGRPPHDMVAGEQRAAFLEREAQVVGHMAGCGNRGKRPAGAGHLFAIFHDPVGFVGAVERGIGARPAVVEHQWGAADDRRAGARRQRLGGG